MPGSENRRAAFRGWLEANGLTVADVARRSKVPASTIYSYLAGKAQSLTGANQEKIARAVGATIEQLFTSNSGGRLDLGVWGKIGAGADVYPLTDYQNDPMYEVALPATLDPNADYVAFEVDGLSMPPAEPGWLVVFRRVEAQPEDLLNSPCLVDTADGRRLFKRLRRGYTPGRYNLESWDGSPLMEDVHVLRVLPFAVLSPGRKAR